MLNSTWLEELASESNTIQTQEDIMSATVLGEQYQGETIYTLLIWLFDDISGWRAMLNSKWIEELASESNIIQAQEDMMSAINFDIDLE